MNSPTQSCRLCLETGDDFVNVFESFQNTTIAAILSKYFWFQVLEHDGMSEWLCQICWIQTKTFHNFYKRVELRHGNFRRPIEPSRSEIKKEQSNNSPVLQTLETDLNLVKREETEPTVPLTDFSISKEENSDFEDSDEVVNHCSPSKNYDNRDHEDQAFGTKTSNNSADGNIGRKDCRSLSQSEREDQDLQIREFFNMKCEICNDVDFDTLFKAKQHYRKVHKTKGYVTCCGRKFFYLYRIVKHVRHHINPDAYHCDQCNKSFSEENSLKSHIDNHIPLDSREFKCSLCPSSFAKEYTLKLHVQQKHTSKTGEKFPCDKCGKFYRSTLLLSCHIRQVHNQKRDYVCEVCARTFKNKPTLENHVKYEHLSTPRPKVQCDICGVWLSNLGRHMMDRHLDSKSDTIKCSICNKALRSKRNLERHIAYVHGEKCFPCTLCDKAFKSSTTLKKHIAIHTGEDLYSCPYCEKKFKSNANMYSHRKKAHLTEWTRDFSKSKI